MDNLENENIQEQDIVPATEISENIVSEELAQPEESQDLMQPDVSVAEEAVAQEETVEYEAPHVVRSPFENSPYEMAHKPVNASANAPKKAKKNSGKLGMRILCAMLALVILVGSCCITAAVISDQWEERLEQLEERYDAKIKTLEKQIGNATNNSGNSISGSPAPVGDGMTPSQVYAANVQSVVMIYAEISATVFGQVTKSASTGSGFIISEEGHVVTNYHVVEGATALSIMLHDGTEIEAELIGADSANDIALLKVSHEGLRPVIIGSSDRLIVGDQVVAIGNPLGELTSTLTVGYVSAKERDVSTDGTVINMIQTDAAINSGNSGGPLFNMMGEVVGITTAKYSGTSNSGATIEGIGFAIPIDDVYDMLDDLINYGYITGAYLGIEVSDTNPEAATYFGYPLGAYVHSVEKGSCAQEAGILAKDIIIEMGGLEVGGLNDLSRALRQFDPGDTTTIVVFRLGQEITLEITLDAKPQSDSTP